MPLTAELLARLDAQWARLRPEWHATLGPGLSDDEQDRVVESLGLNLPTELRTWWGWHAIDSEVPIAPRCDVFSLPHAAHRAALRHKASTAGSEPSDCWPSGLLPIARWGRREILADADVRAPAAPLFVEDAGDPTRRSKLAFPSLGTLIHRWVETYEADYYQWDDDRRTWNGVGVAEDPIQHNPL